MTCFSNMSVVDGIDHLARAMAVGDPRQVILDKISKKLKKQQAVIDMLQEERRYGEMKTILGVPIDEALDVLTKHIEATNA